MFRICFFVSLCYLSNSYTFDTTLTVGHSAVALPPFGFSVNGSVKILLRSNTTTMVRIMLMPYYVYAPPRISDETISLWCSKPNVAADTRRNIEVKIQRAGKANITVDNAGIYFLVVMDCYSSIKELRISAQYRNPQGYLDSRDRYTPELYGVSSLVYALLGFMWYVNSIQYPEFRIQIHNMLNFVPIAKAIQSSITAIIWARRNTDDFVSNESDFIDSLLKSLVHGALMYSIGLCSTGHSVFRETITTGEYTELWGSILIFSMGQLFFSFRDFNIVTYAATIFSCVGLLWYIKMITANLMMLYSTRLESSLDTVFNSKIMLVQGYLSYTVFVCVICLILNTVIGIFVINNVFSRLLFEATCVILIVIQFLFFSFRRSYRGMSPEPKKTVETHTERWPALLVEPNGEHISFVHTG